MFHLREYQQISGYNIFKTGCEDKQKWCLYPSFLGKKGFSNESKDQDDHIALGLLEISDMELYQMHCTLQRISVGEKRTLLEKGSLSQCQAL